jgi:CS domain
MHVLLHCNALQSLRQQLLELNKQRAAASQSVTAAAALHTTAAAQLAQAQSQAAAAGAAVDAAAAKLPQQAVTATAADTNTRPPVVALSALQRGLSWQQTPEDLSVYLKLPHPLKPSQVQVDIQSAALIARIAPAVHSGVSAKQQPQGELLLRGRLWGRIASSDSTWWLEDSGTVLCFNLQKHHLQHTEEWECLFQNSEWEGGLHWSSYGSSSSRDSSGITDDSTSATAAAAGTGGGDDADAAAAGAENVPTTAAAVDATVTGNDAVISVQTPPAADFTIAAELIEAAAQAAATELAVTPTTADTDTEKTTIADEPTVPIVRTVSAMSAELQCSAVDTTSSSSSSSSNAIRLCVQYTLHGGCSDDRDYIAAYRCDADGSTSVSEIGETSYDCMEYLPDTAVGQCSGGVTLTLPAEAKAGAVYTIRYIAVQSNSGTATDGATTGASSAVQHVAIRGVPHAAGIGAAVYTVAATATKHADSSTTASRVVDTSSSVSAKLVYRAPAKWLLEQQVCTKHSHYNLMQCRKPLLSDFTLFSTARAHKAMRSCSAQSCCSKLFLVEERLQ